MSKQSELWWWKAYWKWLRNDILRIFMVQRFISWHMDFTIRPMMKVNNLTRIKRRWDRGGGYLNYITFLISGGTFLKVFGITQWYWYLIGIIAVVSSRYLAGYMDDKMKILSNEQDQYTRKVKTFLDIEDKLDEINKKLNER